MYADSIKGNRNCHERYQLSQTYVQSCELRYHISILKVHNITYMTYSINSLIEKKHINHKTLHKSNAKNEYGNHQYLR